jgi:hypothetical protein
MLDKNIPGPGKYNALKPFGHDAPKYSLYSRRGSIMDCDKTKVPGPGYYKTTFSPDEKYASSKMKNLCNITWSSSKVQRFGNQSKSE